MLPILTAIGGILLLTVLTVLLPAWAITGSIRRGVRAWIEWTGGMVLLLGTGGLIGLAWAMVERLI